MGGSARQLHAPAGPYPSPIRDEPALVVTPVRAELRAQVFRCELDASSDHIKAEIASAEQMKVHTMLVIGGRDMEANAVSVRINGQGNLGARPRDEVIAGLLHSISQRATETLG